MDIWTRIANNKIDEAIKEGKFDNLPGQGKPLDLSDDEHIPPEMRLAFRIMKNAGVSPIEVSLRKELNNLKEELKHTHSQEQRTKLEREIGWMCLRMSMMSERKS